MTFLTSFHLGCNAIGSVLLKNATDTADVYVERNWFGERYINIAEQCTFEVYETGYSLRERPATLISTCEECTFYELQATPTFVDCPDLGTLSVGGQKYRAVRSSNDGLDLWYVSAPTQSSPDWSLSFIATAQGDDSSWSYTVQDTLQDLVYTTQGQFSLEP